MLFNLASLNLCIPCPVASAPDLSWLCKRFHNGLYKPQIPYFRVNDSFIPFKNLKLCFFLPFLILVAVIVLCVLSFLVFVWWQKGDNQCQGRTRHNMKTQKVNTGHVKTASPPTVKDHCINGSPGNAEYQHLPTSLCPAHGTLVYN